MSVQDGLDLDEVMAQLRELTVWLERNKVVLIVAPDQVERVRGFVRVLPFEYMPGLIEVKPLPGMSADRMYVVKPNEWLEQAEPMPLTERRYRPEVPLEQRYRELRKRWCW